MKNYQPNSFYTSLFLLIHRVNKTINLAYVLFSEGLVGMAVAGGVIIGVASILGLGIAMAKKN